MYCEYLTTFVRIHLAIHVVSRPPTPRPKQCFFKTSPFAPSPFLLNMYPSYRTKATKEI